MAGLPTTPFTPQGPEVTRIGLGGEGVLRTFGRESEALAVIAGGWKWKNGSFS